MKVNIRYVDPYTLNYSPLAPGLSFLETRLNYLRLRSSRDGQKAFEGYLKSGATLDKLLNSWEIGERKIEHNFQRYKTKLSGFTQDFTTVIEHIAKTQGVKDALSKFLPALVNFIRDPEAIINEMKIFERYLSDYVPSDIQAMPKPKSRYFFAGIGYFIPGPPETGYNPLKKNKIIEAMLTYYERHYGINQYQKYASSCQYSPGPLVLKGLLSYMPNTLFIQQKTFKEDTQFGRMVLHGKNASRFLLILLCSYIQSTLKKSIPEIKEIFDHNMTDENIGRTLYSLLMETLVLPTKKINLYEVLMDTTSEKSEEVEAQARYSSRSFRSPHDEEYQSWALDYFTPHYWENYSFSCKSPFVLTSLILCFSSEIYPLLNHLMLDSFWKSMYQISYRFGKNLNKKFRDFELDPLVQLDALYEQSLLTLATEPLNKNDYHSAFIGVLNFITTYGGSFFQKAYVEPTPIPWMGGHYSSWNEYVIEKEKKSWSLGYRFI